MSGDRYVSLPLVRAESAADGRYVSLALQSDAPPSTILPDGLYSSLFGSALVATLQADGLYASLFGSQFIAFAERTIAATGISQTVIGGATIRNDTGISRATLGVQTAFGTSQVELSRRTINASGVEAPGFGSASVTHWLQRAILSGHGVAPPVPAQPVVTESPRWLTVPWAVHTYYGQAMVGFDRQLGAAGFDAAQIGIAEVRDNRQIAYPQSILPEPPDWIVVQLHTQKALPAGIALQNWEQFGHGAHLVYNSTQVVTLYDAWVPEYVDIVPNPGVNWFDRPVIVDGLWAGVVNDRITVSNIPPPPALPSGVDSAEYGTAFVSNFVRTVDAGGDDLTRFGINAVYNNARLLMPAGVHQAGYGTAAARNDLRIVYMPSNTDVTRPYTEYGTHFVADADRTVAQRVNWDTDTVHGVQRVSLWHAFITPPSIDAPPMNSYHVLERRQNIITFSGEMRSRVSIPTVRRRSIDPEGAYFTEMGNPRLYRDPERLSPGSIAMGAIGSPTAQHRTRTIRAGLFPMPPEISQRHDVRNEIAPPPGEQWAFPTPINAATVNAPSVWCSRLFLAGSDSSQFGQPTVLGNGIFPKGIPPPGYATGGQVGFPVVPGTQWARPLGMESAPPSEPRMSPHYIFGPIGKGEGHPIDYFTHGQWFERPVFGASIVMHEHRTVEAASRSPTIQTSDPIVSNWVRTINGRGLRSQRLGIPKIPTGVPLNPIGFTAETVGTASVAHPEELVRTLTVRSVSESAVGEHETQNQNRTLQLDAGMDATQWELHWVDRAVRTREDVGGDNMALFGTLDISLYVRTMTAEGWDSSEVTHAPGETRWRMRVTRGTAPGVPAVLCDSIDAGRIGAASVSAFERMLGCGGIMGPQAPVPPPVLQASNAVLPHGAGASLDHMQMGSPAMWATGDPLVPHAVDMAAVGSATVASGIAAATLDACAVGEPTIAQPVDLIGDAHALFGSHLLAHGTGGHVCGQWLRGIRAGGYAFDAIGTAGVAHD